jgi:hypothetical protein
MPNVGFETFFPKRVDTVFIVQNITKDTPQEKTIHIFGYPIPAGKERDLLSIPIVSEADIRHSLLKGELRVKGENGEICVTRSNIDLLQFDPEQKAFLESICIDNGLEVAGGTGTLNFAFKQNVLLLGIKNSQNRIFTVPAPDKFINGTYGLNEFRILVRHNGKGLLPGIDYTMSESGGAGTGLDTITITSFKPVSNSTLVADYIVKV